jgi:hypothetical protein
MNTENWRIRQPNENMFFIEADLPDAEKNGHYPRVEVMQEDYGDHNGYTDAIRMEDAKLIVLAPKMKEAITEVLEVLDGNGVPNVGWIKNRLLEALK